MFTVKDRMTDEIFTVYAVDTGTGMISDLSFLLHDGERWKWVRAYSFLPEDASFINLSIPQLKELLKEK